MQLSGAPVMHCIPLGPRETGNLIWKLHTVAYTMNLTREMIITGLNIQTIYLLITVDLQVRHQMRME